MSNSSDALLQVLHQAVLDQFSRGLARGSSLPANPYRRRLYFEGLAMFGENIVHLAGAAALVATNPSAEESQSDG